MTVLTDEHSIMLGVLRELLCLGLRQFWTIFASVWASGEGNNFLEPFGLLGGDRVETFTLKGFATFQGVVFYGESGSNIFELNMTSDVFGWWSTRTSSSATSNHRQMNPINSPWPVVHWGCSIH